MLKASCLVGLIAVLLSAGPAALVQSTRVELAQVHMGMPVRVVLHASDVTAAEAAAERAFARIAALDRMLSDYRADSEVNAVARGAGRWIAVSPELIEVLTLALDVARKSDGAFDPTVAPLVTLWREARQRHRLPAAAELSTARSLVDWRRVAVNRRRRQVRLATPSMRLDLGGIAKGYILQEAARVLRRGGVTRFLVEAGGDLVVGDAPPGRRGWSVELTGGDPWLTAEADALTNRALSTSGPTMQFVEIGGTRYSHVVDPRTGLGLTSDLIAHVVAADGALADALATALTVAGPARAPRLAAKFPGVRYALTRAGQDAGANP